MLVQLKDLNIKVYGPYDSLEHLLMLSSCPLAKKYMEESRSYNWSLIPLLRAMPDLEEIFLWDLNSYMEIMELCTLMKNTTAFTVESDPSTLFLPRMKSFQYHGVQSSMGNNPIMVPPCAGGPWDPLSTPLLFFYLFRNPPS